MAVGAALICLHPFRPDATRSDHRHRLMYGRAAYAANSCIAFPGLINTWSCLFDDPWDSPRQTGAQSVASVRHHVDEHSSLLLAGLVGFHFETAFAGASWFIGDTGSSSGTKSDGHIEDRRGSRCTYN